MNPSYTAPHLDPSVAVGTEHPELLCLAPCRAFRLRSPARPARPSWPRPVLARTVLARPVLARQADRRQLPGSAAVYNSESIAGQ